MNLITIKSPWSKVTIAALSVGLWLPGCIKNLPIADAGGSQSAAAGEKIILDGTASFDAQGQPLQYEWHQVAGSPAVLANADKPMASFTAPNATERLVFELIVRNNTDQDTDQTEVMVSAAAQNRPPQSVAGNAQSTTGGQIVRLDGTASSDPEGAALTYGWAQLSGTPVALSDPTDPRPTFTAPDVDDTLEFELEVRDDQGQADWSVVAIAVQRTVNQAPLADAGADQTAAAGATVVLDGTASRDPEGAALTFGWQQIGGPAITLLDGTTAQPSFTAPNLDGILEFELTVADDTAQTAQDTVSVAVARQRRPELYIANLGGNVTGYRDPLLINGNVAPDDNLLGSQTLLFGSTDIAVNAGGDVIVANGAAPSLTSYDAGAGLNGNVVPDGHIIGPNTGMVTPTGLAMNGPQDLLFVANVGTDSILVYPGTSAPTFNGNLPPARAISTGGAMQIMDPMGLCFGANDDLYVANNALANVLVFGQASTTNGIVTASRIVASPLFTDVMDVVVDRNDTLYVVDGAGFIYMFDQASTLNGPTPPDAAVGVPGSGQLSSIVIDSQGNAYISDMGTSVIYGYDNLRSRNGTFVPDRLIGGPATQLNGPSGMVLVE